MWLDCNSPDGETAFALDDQEEQEMWQDFQILGRVRGTSILYGDTFLCVGRVLMASTFILGAYGEVRGQVHFLHRECGIWDALRHQKGLLACSVK